MCIYTSKYVPSCSKPAHPSGNGYCADHMNTPPAIKAKQVARKSVDTDASMDVRSPPITPPKRKLRLLVNKYGHLVESETQYIWGQNIGAFFAKQSESGRVIKLSSADIAICQERKWPVVVIKKTKDDEYTADITIPDTAAEETSESSDEEVYQDDEEDGAIAVEDDEGDGYEAVDEEDDVGNEEVDDEEEVVEEEAEEEEQEIDDGYESYESEE